MSDHLSVWDEARQIADELDVKMHLAGMDARDRWRALEPRLQKLEHAIAHSGERASESVAHEVREVRDALRALREELYAHARGNYVRGW